MLRVIISPEDISTIPRDRFYHPQPHIMVRMHILPLHHEGESAARIAQLLHRNPKTIRVCLHTYRDGGLQAVYEYEKHKQAWALDGYGELLEQEFEKHPPQSLKEARATIERLTDIKRSLSQVRAFLKKRDSVFENGKHSLQSLSCRPKRFFGNDS
jgi:transposase